jgi:energy-coupling factor transporter ATP-binding protein EcfA2
MTDTANSIPAQVPISRFFVKGLFGDRDVDIRFSTPVTVLNADNGSGKTTVLSMIYAVLSRQLHKLRKYNFDLITVETSNGSQVTITPEAAHAGIMSAKLEPRFRRLLHSLPEEYLFRLMDETRGLSLSAFRSHPLVTNLSEMASVPPGYVVELLRSELIVSEGKEESPLIAFEKIRKDLADAFPYTTLYFPTYRRIEEELEDLGYTRKEGLRTEALIRFGMGDVTQRIKDITGRIEKSSVEWYARTSGEMLSKLVDGITLEDDAKRSIQDRSALSIVLDRVGPNLSTERKLRIMQLVDSGDISGTQFETLAYFLSNLIKVYDQQKAYDTAIKDFTRVCNKYLNDKEVVYNESTVDLKVVDKRSQKPVELAKLSSGEKQIVSLFSRVYLEDTGSLAVLFDEPELSLSIETSLTPVDVRS